jgi:hypothetical protein
MVIFVGLPIKPGNSMVCRHDLVVGLYKWLVLVDPMRGATGTTAIYFAGFSRLSWSRRR